MGGRDRTIQPGLARRSEAVQGNFQVGATVVFRGRELAGPDIDLDRREHESRDRQGFVAGMPFLTWMLWACCAPTVVSQA